MPRAGYVFWLVAIYKEMLQVPNIFVIAWLSYRHSTKHSGVYLGYQIKTVQYKSNLLIFTLNLTQHFSKLSSVSSSPYCIDVAVTADCGRLRLKRDGTRAGTRFPLSAKRTSPFKSAGGRQFSRLLAVEVCASAVVMLDKPCSEVV